ncbi:MAG: hypothetical protein NTV94_03270 [Planctomycetota bacterium]|nr:hypothetical protein [Planctomycetota bacterium]
MLAGVVASTCSLAMAQATPPAQDPLDINNPRALVPAQPAKPAEAKAAAASKDAAVPAKPQDGTKDVGAAAGQASAPADPAIAAAEAAKAKEVEATSGSAKAPGQAVPADGNPYKVSRFLIEWHLPSDQHPSSEDLMDTQVTLGVTAQGYVSAYELSSRGDVVTDKAGVAVARTGTNTTVLKIRDLAQGAGGTFYASAIRDINQALVNAMNERGFIAVFAHAAGDDLRAGKTEDLRLVIWTGQVGMVRSIASGPRLDGAIAAGEIKRVDSADPVQTRIREQSPIKNGDLVRKDVIDDYLFRLNRHPGRRVDVAIAPAEKPEEVALDYLVSENKPWTAYFQLSNTGTEATNLWRERFGFVHNQLTKHDDILRLDYITGGFDQAHAVNLDWQFRDVFIDATGGLKWQSVDVTNSILQQNGSVDYVTPYIGLNLERFTDESSLFAGATVSWNVNDLDADQKDNLGRPSVDESFTVIRFQAEQSMFLEPIFNDWGLFSGDDGKGLTSLAHEIAFSGRGQWSFDNRLIPTEEEVAGGLFSVRGYPESLAAGDNVFIGSFEYRFHLPNSFTLSDPGKLGREQMPDWFGRDFRWAPQQAYARADWDLIFKAFFDMASVNQVDKEAGEVPDTLFSTGIGLEAVFKRNVSARLDWGMALKDAGPEKLGSKEREVEAGNTELHFLMTISY